MKLKKNEPNFLKNHTQFQNIRKSYQLAISGKNSHIIRRHRTFFPFVSLPDDAEHKTFLISPFNLFCFHGFNSVFTLQHRSDFVINSVLYKSVDQYYQIRKIKDLLGIESEKFTDGSVINYSLLARDLLKQSSIDRTSIDKWRVTCGVNVIQKALLEKIRQHDTLRDLLIQTGNKLIVHTYASDNFFGTGVPFKYVKDWSARMEEKKVAIKISMSYPLISETLKSVPTIGKGRNVLGVIYMILREKLDTLNVDLIKFENDTNAFTFNSFKKINSKKNNNVEIDFTADYDDSVIQLTSKSVSVNNIL